MEYRAVDAETLMFVAFKKEDKAGFCRSLV